MGRFIAACLGCVLAALVFAPTSGAFIYWLSYDSANSRVGRANLNGTHVKPSLVDGIYYGAGVASDGKRIYWGESGSNPTNAAIGRATTRGKRVRHRFLTAPTFCGIFGVRATTKSLHWIQSDCSSTRSIDYVPQPNPGGGYTQVGAGPYACGFDVDKRHVYWSEGHYIARAKSKVAATPNHTWLDIGDTHRACGVAVNGNFVYWTNGNPNGTTPGTTIGRAKINGSESSVRNNFITGASLSSNDSTPASIALDAKHLYWVNFPTSGVYGSIGRADIDGKHVKQNFVKHVFFAVGLDVDGH